MDEIRILSPTGVAGSGFQESSFERALGQKPDFIGCDAGSTDPGPEYLGSGRTAFPPDAIRRDLRLIVRRYGHLPARQAVRRDEPRGGRGTLQTVTGEGEVLLLRPRARDQGVDPASCGPGDPADSDGHGGQQYAPLMDIEIP